MSYLSPSLFSLSLAREFYMHVLRACQRYKRFQLTFHNAEDSSAAGNSIKHICPFTSQDSAYAVQNSQKDESGIQGALQRTTEPRIQSQPAVTQPVVAAVSSDRENPLLASAPASAPAKPTSLDSTLTLSQTTPLFSNPPSKKRKLSPSPVLSGQPHSAIPAPSLPPLEMPSSQMPPPSQFHQSFAHPSSTPIMQSIPVPIPPSQPLPSSSQAPSLSPSYLSSLTTSFNSSNRDELNPSSSGTTVSEPDILSMSQAELERMIAEVIQEPGFGELVRFWLLAAVWVRELRVDSCLHRWKE